MRVKKVNWKLKDKELIHDIIEVLRHYKKRLNVNDKNYCWNSMRRFKIQKYYDTLLDDLKLQVSCYKFFRKAKKGQSDILTLSFIGYLVLIVLLCIF